MKAIILQEHFSGREQIRLAISDVSKPQLTEGHCLVKVHSSGVNPSDALGSTGYFSHAQLPRIPGRDFSGEIVEGAPHLVGKRVWGTGGSAGLDSDGCHAEYLLLPETAIAEVPHNLSMNEAGAQVLPYVTAYYGLIERARIQKGENILITGGLGQVGRAALSICRWLGCHPIALVRQEADIQRAKELGWKAIDTLSSDHKFDVILNSLGNIHWESLISSLKRNGRIVIIGAKEGQRIAQFNLFEFYRANQEICGVNTVDFNFTQNAEILNVLKPAFESNDLCPLPIEESGIFPLGDATAAYQAALGKSGGKRIVLQMHSPSY